MPHSDAFIALREFITRKMRMSHIYQPVMLKTLLEHGGEASLRQIASAFLTRDESQLEYYEHITKVMPGRVLASHGLVARSASGFRLLLNTQAMPIEERDEIMRLCDKALEDYLERRGATIYDHRRQALGYIPGTLRYEVLKRSGNRCELCGVSSDEQALEVDHIIPRKHGGVDALENLQALCWRCNGDKGARDSTDFRAVREGLTRRETGCVFCEVPQSRVEASNSLAFAVRDNYPVTPLHTLVVPHRHAMNYFDLYNPERRAVNDLLDDVREALLQTDRTIEGFNVGTNNGEVAGQTIFHCHVHLIPRRRGDVEDPRGGVRGLLPGRASY